MSDAMTAAPSSAPSSSPAPSAAPSTSANSAASSTPSSSSKSGNTPPTGSSPSGQTANPSAQNTTGSPTATAADATAKTAAAVAEAERRHKLKINGREVEMSEQEVLRQATLAAGADAKFREAAELRNQTQQFVDYLKANPAEALSKLGIDVRQFTEKHLASELQREMMTPEQREMAELRAYKDQQTKAQEQAKLTATQQAEQAHFQQMQQRAAQEYDVQITDALKTSGLPKNADSVRAVVTIMKNALERGYEIDVPTAVDMAKQQSTAYLQSITSQMDAESLIKFFGADMAKKIRLHDLAQLKKMKADTSAQPAAPAAAAPAPRPDTDSTLVGQRQDQWLAALRKKAGI